MLQYVGGSVYINGNPNLHSLGALPQTLNQVKGVVRVLGLPQPDTLAMSALAQSRTVFEYVQRRNNITLPYKF